MDKNSSLARKTLSSTGLEYKENLQYFFFKHGFGEEEVNKFSTSYIETILKKHKEFEEKKRKKLNK